MTTTPQLRYYYPHMLWLLLSELLSFRVLVVVRSSSLFLLFTAVVVVVVVVDGQQPSDNVTIGQQICTAGLIMDEFCINRGTLLDDDRIVTLEDPIKHSIHCLVDVGLCVNSPFHILEQNAPDVDTPYGPGWAVDDNKLLVETARAHGDCGTCSGDLGDRKRGFRAEVIGFVQSLNPKPILQVVSVRYLESSTVETCTNMLDPNATAPPTTTSGSGGSHGLRVLEVSFQFAALVTTTVFSLLYL